jgi:hypothetical protein
MVYINMQLLRGASPTTCVYFHTNLWFGVRGRCFPNSFLDGFVEKGFGCGYVSFIVKSLSFIVFLPKADPPMAERLKAKPTSETDT